MYSTSPPLQPVSLDRHCGLHWNCQPSSDGNLPTNNLGAFFGPRLRGFTNVPRPENTFVKFHFNALSGVGTDTCKFKKISYWRVRIVRCLPNSEINWIHFSFIQRFNFCLPNIMREFNCRLPTRSVMNASLKSSFRWNDIDAWFSWRIKEKKKGQNTWTSSLFVLLEGWALFIKQLKTVLFSVHKYDYHKLVVCERSEVVKILRVCA